MNEVKLPLVIEYLKTHSLADLREEHGVCSRLSADGTKVSLDYHQFESKYGDPLAEQCRGLIVRHESNAHVPAQGIVGSTKIVAWPMYRFYNHGDPCVAKINAEDPKLRVLDKVDGTMIIMYYDRMKNEWFAATRSVPEADVPIRNDSVEHGSITFSGLFFKTLREEYPSEYDEVMDTVERVRKDTTYVFELTTPLNKNVVEYERPGLTLLAARDNSTGQEYELPSYILEGIPRPRMRFIDRFLGSEEMFFTFLKTDVETINPSKGEGYVVVDSQYNRVKVKSRAYAFAMRNKDRIDNFTMSSALELIVIGSIDDVIVHLGATGAEKVRYLIDGYAAFCRHHDAAYATLLRSSAGSRKEFALNVAADPTLLAGIMFTLYTGRAKTTHEHMLEGVKEKRRTLIEHVLEHVNKHYLPASVDAGK